MRSGLDEWENEKVIVRVIVSIEAQTGPEG
jgi:hypothetical protein